MIPDLGRDLLVREYEKLPELIAHWDWHFWQKSQFFFAVESLLLGAVAVAFHEPFLKGAALGIQAFCGLVGLSVFNFWLCYVWFRTNRSNREFLGPIFTRARAIERALVAASEGGTPVGQLTFNFQWQSLREERWDRHASHVWENHLPTGFAVSWVAVLTTAGFFSHERLYLPWSLYTVLLALLIVVLVEFHHPRRSRRRE